ncbi:MAG: ATP-dependent sacrificial sulfur transferase LarE [Deltaproteobacteria bacterium]|nr:ATP-dependent sacrificial sulfur transferase LarE [Deltaproteobacteria bacterium]
MTCGKTDETANLPGMLREKYDRLRQIIIKAGDAAIGFSGGVDSTFLLKVCAKILGERVLAITMKSEMIPANEVDAAHDIAGKMGVKHIILKENLLELPGFVQNHPDRCYICKKAIFSQIKKKAELYGIRHCFDGSNIDDASDFRPGRVALSELGVRSPLVETGFLKSDIRAVSKSLKLPTWNKPALACLASRFPYYTEITKDALKQVENAETFLGKLGMHLFRVRHHDILARIELGEREKKLLLEFDLCTEIVKHLKNLGYKYISLDLEGYRTGSMNEAL